MYVSEGGENKRDFRHCAYEADKTSQKCALQSVRATSLHVQFSAKLEASGVCTIMYILFIFTLLRW